MVDIDPSILNHIRRSTLARDPERSVIPALPKAELSTSTETPDIPFISTLGRLAARLSPSTESEAQHNDRNSTT